MHGLSIKSHTGGAWDWETAASLYDYSKDQKRQNSAANTLPGAASNGAGTIADGAGTGWNTLALKGVWRPDGVNGAHIVDVGVQQDRYTLKYRTSNIAGNWISDGAGTLASEVGGKTRLQSMYVQDSWTFDPKWKTVLGARAENWTASNGFTNFGVGNPAIASYASRSENFISPKAALSYQFSDDTVVNASAGRAVHACPPFQSCMAQRPPPTRSSSTIPTWRRKGRGPPSLRRKKTWATGCCV